MKTTVASWLLLGLAATLPAQTPEPDSRIRVFVYNWAGVEAATLARAERQATAVYARAGIQAEFIDCPLSAEQAPQFPACHLPPFPAALIVRLLSRPMAESIGLRPPTFGTALSRADGTGTLAQVCAECCQQSASGLDVNPADLLGHVMAHEVGHLLLGSGSHGPSGLMHFPWRGKELDNLGKGSLLFSSQEAGKMRRNAAERLASSTVVAQAHTN